MCLCMVAQDAACNVCNVHCARWTFCAVCSVYRLAWCMGCNVPFLHQLCPNTQSCPPSPHLPKGSWSRLWGPKGHSRVPRVFFIIVGLSMCGPRHIHSMVHRLSRKAFLAIVGCFWNPPPAHERQPAATDVFCVISNSVGHHLVTIWVL